MRALTIAGFGTDPEITEIPDPRPGPGEVLVQVETSSLNGFDVALCAGYLEGLMEHRFPVVVGKDYAGTVTEVMEESAGFAPGDRVFGVVMKETLGDGSLGEYVAVGTQYAIAPVPEGLDMPTAGALGLAGSTAVTCLEKVDLKAGETVLISGATGGVGAIAVQLAASAGATVIATATPGERSDFVSRLGAAHVVDYSGDVSDQVRRLTPDGVAVALHLAGSVSELADLLSPGGRVASAVDFGVSDLGDRDAAGVFVVADPSREVLDRLAALAASGSLEVPITHTFPLERGAEALGRFRAGKMGKISVTVL